MSMTHIIRIRDCQNNRDIEFEVQNDQYILHSAEDQGIKLPFSCRNGACTTCAVRVLNGNLDQPEAMGLSPHLQKEGYALLCVSYAQSSICAETQEEDEVYEMQFGQFFGKGKVKAGIPIEDE
ncbi:MAG: 2Fe-2S iron-sulfur cluster-binding protein [Cyanobacteria bacterium P01_F01_bin.42]